MIKRSQSQSFKTVSLSAPLPEAEPEAPTRRKSGDGKPSLLRRLSARRTSAKKLMPSSYHEALKEKSIANKKLKDDAHQARLAEEERQRAEMRELDRLIGLPDTVDMTPDTRDRATFRYVLDAGVRRLDLGEVAPHRAAHDPVQSQRRRPFKRIDSRERAVPHIVVDPTQGKKPEAPTTAQLPLAQTDARRARSTSNPAPARRGLTPRGPTPPAGLSQAGNEALEDMARWFDDTQPR